MSNRTLNTVLLAVIAVLLVVVTVLLMRPAPVAEQVAPQRVTVPASAPAPTPAVTPVSPAYVQPAPNQPGAPVQVTPPAYTGSTTAPVNRLNLPPASSSSPATPAASTPTNWSPDRSGKGGAANSADLAPPAEFQAFVQWVSSVETERAKVGQALNSVITNLAVYYEPPFTLHDRNALAISLQGRTIAGNHRDRLAAMKAAGTGDLTVVGDVYFRAAMLEANRYVNVFENRLRGVYDLAREEIGAYHIATEFRKAEMALTSAYERRGARPSINLVYARQKLAR